MWLSSCHWRGYNAIEGHLSPFVNGMFFSQNVCIKISLHLKIVWTLPAGHLQKSVVLNKTSMCSSVPADGILSSALTKQSNKGEIVG